MQFSLSWLRQHIDLTLSVEDLCKKLDEIGLEVESFEDSSQKYKDFIVAEVISAEHHPNADSLRICKVNTGSEVLNVVCGAANARTGIKVILAKVGATVPNGSFIIKKSKIRGIESEGMMCSADELDLMYDPRFNGIIDGIIELGDTATVGMDFSEYSGLNEVIIEVALTPNRRKDCASVYGIARDLAAAGVGTLKHLKDTSIKTSGMPKVRVQIDAKDHCSQFNFFTAEADKIRDIPEFLTKIKESSNNDLVNISNFAMFDLGNPNHFYDLDKISGNTIYIRMSEEDEEFIALGGKKYILPKDILVVADAEKILCVAGVMGGEFSKVDESTRNVLVEVANFKPEAVSFSGQRLSIKSDSRFRFESGIDSGSVDVFSKYLAGYFSESSEIQKEYGVQDDVIQKMEISIDRINLLLGIEVNKNEVKEILERLSFSPDEISEGVFEVTVPSWKQGNIEAYHDVIEDLLRMGLMDRINSSESNRRLIRTSDIKQNTLESIANNSSENIFNPRIITHSTASNLRSELLGRGMHEVLTWPFYSDEEKFSIEKNHLAKYCLKSKSDENELVMISNPINSNFTCMRRSIVPNLVNVLTKNPNNKEKTLSIFEIGNIYSNNIEGMQTFCVAGLRAGDLLKNTIHSKNRSFGFFDVREDLLSLMKVFGMSNKVTDYAFDFEVPQYYHPSKSIRIKLGNIVIGICGELHPSIVKDFEINHSSVAIFELFTHNVPMKAYKLQQHKPFMTSNYQKIRRDLAFILDNETKVGDVIKTIFNLKEKLIEDVDVFDVYNGIAEGKKSVAFSIDIQPIDSNITDEIINGIMDRVVQAVKDKNNGILRDK